MFFKCIFVFSLLATTVYPANAGDMLAKLKKTNHNGQVVVPDCLDISPEKIKAMSKRRFRCALGSRELNNRRIVSCSWYQEIINSGKSWRKQHTMRKANDF